jgi:hypothetical protein
MSLDDAIATLCVREINCSCETFWDGGMKFWVGDIKNGHHSETTISEDNTGKAMPAVNKLKRLGGPKPLRWGNRNLRLLLRSILDG